MVVAAGEEATTTAVEVETLAEETAEEATAGTEAAEVATDATAEEAREAAEVPWSYSCVSDRCKQSVMQGNLTCPSEI